jgi:hypothetical protein
MPNSFKSLGGIGRLASTGAIRLITLVPSELLIAGDKSTSLTIRLEGQTSSYWRSAGRDGLPFGGI